MRAGVRRALVEPQPGDHAVEVGAELRADLDRVVVGRLGLLERPRRAAQMLHGQPDCVGARVVNVQLSSLAIALPAKSFTPDAPPLTSAVYVVVAASDCGRVERRGLAARVVAHRRRDERAGRVAQRDRGRGDGRRVDRLGEPRRDVGGGGDPARAAARGDRASPSARSRRRRSPARRRPSSSRTGTCRWGTCRWARTRRARCRRPRRRAARAAAGCRRRPRRSRRGWSRSCRSARDRTRCTSCRR